MQQVQCVRLAWCKRPPNTSHIELVAQLVKCFASAKIIFSMLFLLNLFKNLNLCTSYIQQVMNVFSFVQWYKYFHSVKDEMHHSTRPRLVEWNISSFTSWKYLYHCTHKHSLFVYYFGCLLGCCNPTSTLKKSGSAPVSSQSLYIFVDVHIRVICTLL